MFTNTPRTTASRRSILRAVAVAAVTLATASVTAPTATLAQATTQLYSGNYKGYWHDGRAMVERVSVTPSVITAYRVAGGDVQGQTARYIRSGPNSYNSTTGHIITVTGPDTFTWTNSSGRNGVAYTLMQ